MPGNATLTLTLTVTLTLTLTKVSVKARVPGNARLKELPQVVFVVRARVRANPNHLITTETLTLTPTLNLTRWSSRRAATVSPAPYRWPTSGRPRDAVTTGGAKAGAVRYML